MLAEGINWSLTLEKLQTLSSDLHVFAEAVLKAYMH